ncbi:MAG: DUF2092 domain-containing protein [Myxococcota bacterium]
MKAMSEFLSKQAQFSFTSRVRYDRTLEDGGLVEVNRTHQVHALRPSRLRATLVGDRFVRALFVEKNKMTIYDLDRNEFFQASGGKTIDSAMEKLVTEFGQSLPGVDFVYSNPYASLMSNVRTSRYMGVEVLDGRPVHHLVFGQADVEWQLWIEEGPHPAPTRIVINYIGRPGRPRFSADLTWDFSDVPFSTSTFTFAAPEGAKKVASFPSMAN